MHLKGSERERESERKQSPTSGSLPKWLQQTGLGQTNSLELHLRLPQRFGGQKALDHLQPLSQAHYKAAGWEGSSGDSNRLPYRMLASQVAA